MCLSLSSFLFFHLHLEVLFFNLFPHVVLFSFDYLLVCLFTCLFTCLLDCLFVCLFIACLCLLSLDNEVSSRSHTIFRMVIESTQRHSHVQSDGDSLSSSSSSSSSSAALPVRTAMLNLVDLAGSENAVKAGSSDRRKETGYINRSLLTLGHVIWKLSEKSTTHIPYR